MQGGKRLKVARYIPLRDLLLRPQLELATVLCSALVVHDRWQIVTDPIARVFLAHGHGCAAQLLKPFISADVAAAQSAETLFRPNTPASRMMAVLYRQTGNEYLKWCLFPAVTEVCSNETAWESLDSKGDERMLGIARVLVSRIVASEDRCPKLLRSLFRHAASEAGKRFPQSRLAAAGSFFFLRYLVPALANPSTHAITDETIAPGAKRVLVQISSIVQRLANGTLSVQPPLSASGERPIPGITEWAERTFPQVLDFLDRLCAERADEPAPDPIGPKPGVLDNEDDLALIHDVATKSLDPVMDALAAKFPKFDTSVFRDAITTKSRLFVATAAIQIPSPVAHRDPTPQGSPPVHTAEDDFGMPAGSPVTFGGTLEQRLDSEIARRRNAEAEARALRMELDALRRHCAVASPDASPQIAAGSRDASPPSVAAVSLTQVQQSPSIVAESVRKRQVAASLTEALAVLSEIRSRVSADTVDYNDVVFLAKLVREVHTFVQLPLGRTWTEAGRAIPRQYDVSGLTTEKAKAMRMATAKAVEEIRTRIDAIAADLGPLFHLLDLEQRIIDVQSVLLLSKK